MGKVRDALTILPTKLSKEALKYVAQRIGGNTQRGERLKERVKDTAATCRGACTTAPNPTTFWVGGRGCIS